MRRVADYSLQVGVALFGYLHYKFISWDLGFISQGFSLIYLRGSHI